MASGYYIRQNKQELEKLGPYKTPVEIGQDVKSVLN